MQAQRSSAFAILLICSVIAGMAVVIYQAGWLERFEWRLVDQSFRWRYDIRGKANVTSEVVLAGVDQFAVDPSYSKHSDRWGAGGWFSRDHWISAVDCFLYGYISPSVFAYDFIFLPHRTPRRDAGKSDEEIIDQFLRENRGPFAEIVNVPEFPRIKLLNALDEACNGNFAAKFFDVDDTRSAGRKMPYFITAYNFTRKKENESKVWDITREADADKIAVLKKQSLPISWIENIPEDYPYADNALLPFDRLMQAPVRLGYIHVPRDEDGNLRRVRLVDGFRDLTQNNAPVFVPSLALQACLLYLGIHWDPAVPPKSDVKSGVRVRFGEEIHLWAPGHDIHIPIDRHGSLFLNFEGKIRDFPGLSYVDISNAGDFLAAEQQRSLPQGADVPEKLRKAHEVKDLLQDKIVLVGETFTGGSDVGPCAIDDNVPFVFIHMTAIDNILRSSFMRPLGKGWTTVMIAVFPLLVGLLNLRTQARTSASGTFLLLFGSGTVAFGLFYYNVVYVPMVLPGLANLVTFGAVSLYRYQVERKGRLEIRKKFSAMVSGKMLQYMEEHPEKLSGERVETTVFFSDVANFTTVSEKLPPDQLSLILNKYLTPMADIILARDGYVNKFAGDGIMAVWGVFGLQSDHAIQTCVSALEQQAKIKELQPLFRDQYGIQLKVRMGLHSGIVSAGEMGSQNRYEYTVMGDTVNFAARLEPANKDYGTLVLMGELTYNLAKNHIVVRKMDRIVVTGKTETVVIYELIGKKDGVSPQQIKVIELFEQGLNLYWARNWTEASEAFHAVLEINPDDSPSNVFIERIKEYEIQPPPMEWKGEYVRRFKY